VTARDPDEAERLRVLAEYAVMDTAPEHDLDDLVALASAICGTPIALVSLVDDTRQWFKARVGIEEQQTARELAFCAHAIASESPGIFSVKDARVDPRFASNPLVTGNPNVVFYAGAPLIVEGGAKLGTLCVIDRMPRELTPVQTHALETLSKLVVQNLELRRARGIANSERDARDRAELDLKQIFDLSVDLLCWVRDGRWVRVNPAFERTLGWSAEELCGAPTFDFIHPDDLASSTAQRAALDGGDQAIRYEVRYRHKNGGYVWVSWNATHHCGTTYGVGRDVTEERATTHARVKLLEEQNAAREMAEEANRVMDQFLATVSHELRTPLNAMLGWTRLLRGGQLSEAQQPRALETIERNATVQAQLIEDLLDVSRIVSGKMRLDVVPVDLVSVIEAALEVVRPAADAKGVTIAPVLDPAASQVTGDSSRLQQVIWNLLSNAVKFTPKSGRVEIHLAHVGGMIEIAVTDTGAGIAPNFLTHVFERFRQADGAMTRTHGGLGLGLAIVKNLVELHGGSVRAESAGLGLGSSFIVRLPGTSSHVSSIPASQGRTGGNTPFDHPPEIVGLRVLVVDDETDSRELLVMMLRRCGAIVTSAASAREALAMFELDPPALVVSDLGMPKEDGYSFIRKVRALAPDQGGLVPFIALTAYARAEDRTRALRATFDSHVAKPVEPSELLAVIASVVGRSASKAR